METGEGEEVEQRQGGEQKVPQDNTGATTSQRKVPEKQKVAARIGQKVSRFWEITTRSSKEIAPWVGEEISGGQKIPPRLCKGISRINETFRQSKWSEREVREAS